MNQYGHHGKNGGSSEKACCTGLFLFLFLILRAECYCSNGLLKNIMAPTYGPMPVAVILIPDEDIRDRSAQALQEELGFTTALQKHFNLPTKPKWKTT